MHIAFLTPEYPHPKSTSAGGLGTSIKNLAVSLIVRKVTVSVFVYGQKMDVQFEENGIILHFIKQKKYPYLGWYYYRKHLQSYINRFIKSDRIGLLEAPDWTGITALMEISCPVVIRMNGTDAYFCHLEGRKQKWKNRFFEKRALLSADALVSVSAFTAEKTRELFNIKEQIQIIPNSIDTSHFKPSDVDPVKNRLLYFGTIIRKKGVLELAGIFNEVVLSEPTAELYLIGKDVVDIFENRSTLELFISKLSPEALKRIKYFPEVSYSEIRKQIVQATVIVLPSFAEALPMSWLEAMAMGKPMVTSNIGWAPEIMVNGYTGFMEDPKDHKGYAEKILFLFRDPQRAGEMGKGARKQILNNFSTELISHKNINFYEVVFNAQTIKK